MKKIYILLIISFFITQFAFAQTDFNAENKQAFEKKLSEMGLLQTLKLKELKQEKGIYYFRLQFIAENQDESNTAWVSMKALFGKEKSVSLPEYLYFFFIGWFEIPNPQNVLLEIRHSYLTEECPFVQYYFDDKTNNFVLNETLCKADISETIKLNELSFLTKKYVLENKETSKELIYEKLLKRFKEIYTKEKGFEKKSTAKFVPTYRKGADSLTFEVKNLQKEVLTQAGENFVYTMLTFLTGETYLPFEHLKFSIIYNIEKQEIKVKVIGRYGSGLHGNKEWSEMTDMDKGLPVLINNYLKDKVMPDIIRTITKDTNYGQ